MRIKEVNASTESEALAIRTHIFVDWVNGGDGEIQFDVQRYFRDKESGAYFAVDGTLEPSLRVKLSDVMGRVFVNPPERGGGEFPGAFLAACIKTVYEAVYADSLTPPEGEAV